MVALRLKQTYPRWIAVAVHGFDCQFVQRRKIHRSPSRPLFWRIGHVGHTLNTSATALVLELMENEVPNVEKNFPVGGNNLAISISLVIGRVAAAVDKNRQAEGSEHLLCFHSLHPQGLFLFHGGSKSLLNRVMVTKRCPFHTR